MHGSRLYLIVIFVLTGLAACSPVNESTTPSVRLSEAEKTEQDSVLARLDRLNRHAIDRAFALLPHYRYTHTQRLAQLDAQGRATAEQQATVSHAGPVTARTAEPTQVDTHGTFSTSFWASQPAIFQEDTTSIARLILPEEPTYLSPRGRETYRYRMLSDSTLDGLAVHRIDITARPIFGDEQLLRSVRFYLEAASQEVIGIDLKRVQTSLLFDESSTLYLQLQRGPQNTWVPHQLRLDTRTQTLGFAPLHFQRTSTYGDFAVH